MQEKITFDNLAGGALSEEFYDTLEHVLENIMDKNTDHKKARKITMTITLKTTEERDEVTTEFSCKATTAPSKPILTRLLIGKSGGKVVAQEYTKGVIPGQLLSESDGKIVDMRTGEVVSK